MIALYIRLSVADDDLDTEKEESNSIVNQRSLLYDFVKEHPEFSNEEIEEFVDDGYSGMTFERPAFQRMIELVKQRIITVVIVKDFSRFGRDYIEVGDYMERIFPFMGVRFLAVTDGYDSDFRQLGDNSDLEIIMKNIINTYYSKDLSQKIVSSIRAKQRKGMYVYSGRAFGYLKDPDDASKIIVDPEAGKYVRRIFDLALEGKGTGQIAAQLNKDGVPTCNTYNKTRGVSGKSSVQKTEIVYWDAGMVARIISDPVYAGVYISSKSRRVVPGMKKMRKVKQEEQVRIANHHEAIVTQEEFDKAQEVFRWMNSNPTLPYKRNPLSGKVICGHCGHTMIYNERKVMDCFYQCALHYKKEYQLGCPEGRFEEGAVNQLVFRELKKWFEILHTIDRKLQENEAASLEQVRSIRKEIGQQQHKMRTLQTEKVNLYEKYSEGQIGKDDFIIGRDQLAIQIECLRETINALHQKEADAEKSKRKRSKDFNQLMQKVDLFQNEIILTKTMVDVFLERLVVYDDKHFEIHWNWDDMLKKLDCDEMGGETK